MRPSGPGLDESAGHGGLSMHCIRSCPTQPRRHSWSRPEKRDPSESRPTASSSHYRASVTSSRLKR